MKLLHSFHSNVQGNPLPPVVRMPEKGSKAELRSHPDAVFWSRDLTDVQ
jgi:hypothetical protein